MNIQDRFIEALQGVCVLDLETTSLDFKEAEVIEFGYVLHNGHEWNTKGEFHKASVPIVPEVSAITNITNKMVRHAHPFEDVCGDYENDIFNQHGFGLTQVYLIAHNAFYDRNVLERQYSKTEFANNQEWICTMRLAKKLFADDDTVTQYNLPYLRYRFELDIPEDIPHHRASTDAFMTAKLLEYLIAVMIEDELLNIDEPYLDQIAEYINKPVIMTKMPFGKHKGIKFTEIPMSYLEWLINNADSLDESKPEYDKDFAATIINEFERRGVA